MKPKYAIIVTTYSYNERHQSANVSWESKRVIIQILSHKCSRKPASYLLRKQIEFMHVERFGGWQQRMLGGQCIGLMPLLAQRAMIMMMLNV